MRRLVGRRAGTWLVVVFAVLITSFSPSLLPAQMDSALNPAWGNLATDVSTIRVPAGTTIYEGAAAAQPLSGGGSLLGGGSQVFIPNVNWDCRKPCVNGW